MKTNTIKQNIPSGWQEKNLGDVCDIVNGSTPKRSVSEYWENGNIPWFTVDDIRSNGRIISKTNQSITDKALKETSVKLLPEDSVLLCCTASLGEVALTKIPLTTNQQFNGLVSKDKRNLFPYYLFYSAQKLGEGLKSKSGKTTINFLSVGSLSKEKVLIPPIKEQQKIAEILGTVDEDIAKTQGVIEATEKLKRGLMQQLFTRGIGHKKFKETKIGQIPEEWSVKTFEEFAVLQRGFDLPVQDRQSGQYDLITSNGVTDTHAEFKVKGPGVITGRSGTLGNVFYVENNFWPLNTTLYIKDFHGNHEKFVYYKIKSFDVSRFGTGTGVPTLNRNIVHKEIVAVPKYGEQKEIAEILSAVDEKILVNKKLKAKFTLLKKGLMQDLLSGRVRV